MRILILVSLLLLQSFWLASQSTPPKLVHFPQYVAIGPNAYTTNTPAGYNLLVEGGILTERLRVAARNGNNWADYVLAPSYKLAPLPEVEHYVSKYGHLPGIPSAKQVAKEGVDIGQMQVRMMAKIEELTLYAIRQQKEIAGLRRQLRQANRSVVPQR